MTSRRPFTTGDSSPIQPHGVDELDPSKHIVTTLTVTITNLNPEGIQCSYQFSGASATSTPFDLDVTPPSRLDLDVSGYTDEQYQSVLIIINITDTYAYFDSSNQVTTGNTYAATTLRDLSASNYNAAGYPTTVQFYSINKSSTGFPNVSPYGQYNLRVWMVDRVDTSFIIPVVLDPCIKNDG